MVLLIENQQMSKPPSFTCTVCLKKSPALEADWTAFLHEGEDLVCVCVVHDLPPAPALSKHQPGGGEARGVAGPRLGVVGVQPLVQGQVGHFLVCKVRN